MKYVPNSESAVAEMLTSMGMSSLEELFSDIPESVRLKEGDLALNPPMSELELRRELLKKAALNRNADSVPCFLGAGIYDHFIPAAVDQLVSRSEFYTAYTPYQPEISQGILQSIFEYQTMICRLTGLSVSNASLYDGGTALAEACKMSAETTKRKKVLLPETLHPDYAQVVKTYAISDIMTPVSVPMNANGTTDLDKLAEMLDSDVAAVAVPYPNFFGQLEDVAKIRELTAKNKSLMIMVVNPMSLALLKTPGEWNADVAVGDGQVLGNPMSFGGPSFGFLAVSDKYLRKIPGRLVGETTDQQGKRAFVLTLQAREQHIRREKASSNICSNQALNALTALMYLTFVGPKGLKEVALRCHQFACFARNEFEKEGFSLLYNGSFFHEIAIKLSNPKKVNTYLSEQGIIGGFELKNGLMFAFTEKRTKEEIEQLVRLVKEASK